MNGISSELKIIPTLEASAISCACPNKEKPVISVAAFRFNCVAILEGSLFNFLIQNLASSISSFFAFSALLAVVVTPIPKGLVRINISFGFTPDFFRILWVSIIPITTRPNLGSLS